LDNVGWHDAIVLAPPQLPNEYYQLATFAQHTTMFLLNPVSASIQKFILVHVSAASNFQLAPTSQNIPLAAFPLMMVIKFK